MATFYELNEQAAGFYHWYAEKAKGILKYMESRGITKATRDAFGLGASPRYGDTLIRNLKKRLDATDQEIEEAGLAIRNDEGKLVDRFYSRMMIPIRDPEGRCIGFGARRVFGEKGAKYKNSPTSGHFEKKQTLYLFDRAKKGNIKSFVLCEGYMDAIRLQEAGIDTAVASLGTAVTKEHAELMKQYKQSVIILTDMDEPGRKAAEKAVATLRKEGMMPYVCSLEGAKDPDEYLQDHSREELEHALRTSVDGRTYLISRIKDEFSKTGDAKSFADRLEKELESVDAILEWEKIL